MLARVWAPMEITTKIIEPLLYLYARYAIDFLMPPEFNSNKIVFADEKQPTEVGLPEEVKENRPGSNFRDDRSNASHDK